MDVHFEGGLLILPAGIARAHVPHFIDFLRAVEGQPVHSPAPQAIAANGRDLEAVRALIQAHALEIVHIEAAGDVFPDGLFIVILMIADLPDALFILIVALLPDAEVAGGLVGGPALVYLMVGFLVGKEHLLLPFELPLDLAFFLVLYVDFQALLVGAAPIEAAVLSVGRGLLVTLGEITAGLLRLLQKRREVAIS